jgi:hypothetical protein
MRTRPHAIATRQLATLLVKSELMLPLVWHGRLSTALKISSAACQYGRGDVGSRGWMAREVARAMILPEEQSDAKHGMQHRANDEHAIYVCGIQINRM